ncbi:SAGA complex/transcription factor TFIID complex histone H4-like subunit Taf6 [Schizosaccharomyces pombe]|uniref:SAGA complex/transcription factor TFIID complex subunit Taf6 n=1 Tax=Schizosaccharomyces pombe (strain 972 / ATCC 24843) TaxID=284812 RepID=TAF6_SCHPO|nr:histone H4-like protein Taf6 [Schizosaccharomyces pombe]O74462.1 RecName: Full=Transcription initiation factor TFIID subunit 6; AltName: Full=TBP-associated factor 50 kDa; Short=TAFII-50; Short=TAFII50; AltName: Full=TBP-associated factor 6 [Schizosaccharomyces pombe 972h-]CAA20756.1 histone H4-like TAF Taf6, SAGA complex subunit [Schizosaccharomyces pombe]|eukprot:NP_587928.1 histone H4-like protein Taf6 [Schizosaccharomyces pombe]
MSLTVWNIESIKDVAEMLGIGNLADEPAAAIAMDLEYRIHQVVQEATKFMVHSKRTVLTSADISSALRTLNVEPLYGFNNSRPLEFHEAAVGAGQNSLYYLDDEEVDFEKIINAPLPKVPRNISYSAHWLAIEGVQPAIPQNPTPSDHTVGEWASKGTSGVMPGASTAAKEARNGVTSMDNVEIKPLVRHVLSKELQLYFERITSALLDETNVELRDAALSSLRDDPGLHQLLPYFIMFLSDSVTRNLGNLVVLTTLMHMAWALLDNPNLFVEPYVQQLMPSILTCLVAKRLGSDPNNHEHYALRDLAAFLLGIVCDRFGNVYYTLKPRVTRTALKAFLDNTKPYSTHYGAIKGLKTMGKEAIRVLVVPNIKVYEVLVRKTLEKGNEEEIYEANKCMDALYDALLLLRDDQLPNQRTLPPNASGLLEKNVGSLMAEKIMKENDTSLLLGLLE